MDHRWLEIVINARSEELDDLCGKLIANGVPGLAVEEEEEFRAFLEENRQYWDYVDDALMEQMKGVSRVKIYVTDDADGQAQLKGYLAGIDLPYTTAALREYDWAHSWQKYYRPMAVGEKLYIVPEWERDTADIPAGATRLLMNPGLTFGTGSHASTQLCLEGLEACTRKGDRVLDLGCGSGILAIAALCLGASQAVGVDIDPKAVDVALKLGAKVVWLPTQSARNHMVKNNLDPAGCVDVVRDGKVVPELNDVFGLIRDHNAVLGTAHVSPEEAFIVVEAARNAGVKNIVVTHPEWWIVDMSVEDQVRIVKDYDVILERCYAQNMGGGKYKSNLPSNVEIIKEVGYQNVMVDTDGGQTENPHWELAMEEYMQYLVDHGIPEEHVYHMTRTIPSRLLGLED